MSEHEVARGECILGRSAIVADRIGDDGVVPMCPPARGFFSALQCGAPMPITRSQLTPARRRRPLSCEPMPALSPATMPTRAISLQASS